MKFKTQVLFLFFIIGFSFQSQAQFLKKHRDSIDGAIDLSHFLKDLNGVLPILSPITEPAVGYGLVGAGLYFIAKEEKEEKSYQAPDIAGIGGGFTENGTWFAGAGYIGFWKNDNLRYRGVIAVGDISLEYFRKDNTPLLKKSRNLKLADLFFYNKPFFEYQILIFLREQDTSFLMRMLILLKILTYQISTLEISMFGTVVLPQLLNMKSLTMFFPQIKG